MSDDIEVTRKDGVQTIRFARAAKKNALTRAMYAATTDALQDGDASSDIAIHVILGADGIFCAGNDIGDFLATSKGSDGMSTDVERFVRLLPHIAKPIIAGVDGPAVGVGTTLLLHCDLVYATPRASFMTPFLDLGLVPEAASSLLAPMRFGYARAFEMLVLGNAFTADKARDLGLINEIVPSGQLETTVYTAARRLASKPPEALAAARRLMRGDPAAVSAQIEAELVAFKASLASPEAREALQAFLEKRPPNFAATKAKG